MALNAGIVRRRGNRADALWRRWTIAGVRIGLEARGIRATGHGDAYQAKNCNARPGNEARIHLGGRHVVTHSYA